MQQAVEVAQVRNDEMAAATKTAECQNGLPGESGGNLGPRRANKCAERECLASLLSTGAVGLGRGFAPTALCCESRVGIEEAPAAAAQHGGWRLGWFGWLAWLLAGGWSADLCAGGAAWRRRGVAGSEPLKPYLA